MLISVIVAGALVFLLLAWFWLRSATVKTNLLQGEGRGASVKVARSDPDPLMTTLKQDFRSVTIDSTASGAPCQTAIELADERFLLADAPMLPLPGCNSNSCRCGYARQDDRRDFDRRANHDMHEAVCQSTGISNRRSLRNRRGIK